MQKGYLCGGGRGVGVWVVRGEEGQMCAGATGGVELGYSNWSFRFGICFINFLSYLQCYLFHIKPVS